MSARTAPQTSVFDVAEYILEKHAQANPERPRMSAVKLQILVYYCQAWHLVRDCGQLFPEEFQAWANGPVCPALYELHKGHFEIEAGFFAKRLRVRNDVPTAGQDLPVGLGAANTPELSLPLQGSQHSCDRVPD